MKLSLVIFSVLFVMGLEADPSSDLFLAIRKSDRPLVEKILNSGVDTRTTDGQGKTALQVAIEKDETEIAKLLIERNSGFFENHRLSSLYLTKACENGNDIIVDALLNAGVSAHDSVNRNGENCLDIARALSYRGLETKMENLGLKAKDKYNSTYTVPLYIIYILISLAMTIWVARTLNLNGRIFLVDALKNENLADSVNHLLVVGFYLINIGFITLALKIGLKPTAVVEAIEILSNKIGMVLVVLGIMHFFNLYMFGRLRKKTSENRALANKEGK